MSNSLTTLNTYSSEIEALMDQSKLEASGIDSFVFKDDLGGMRPHLQTSLGVELKVRNKDYDIALKIIGGNDLRDYHYDSGKNKIALISLTGVTICGVGIALIIIGFQNSAANKMIGTGLAVSGLALEFYSRLLKKKLK